MKSNPESESLGVRPLAGEGRGAIFTRRWVADLILDLAGYSHKKDLASKIVIEPACGNGVFLEAIVERLIRSCTLKGRPLSDAVHALRAFDIDQDAVGTSRSAITKLMITRGVRRIHAERLATGWITSGDFLLSDDCSNHADFVVGNPPYVRVEQVPIERNKLYRERWQTMTGRADLYVGFLEAGLDALRPGGTLVYICADRWMRNQYGAGLRKLVESAYSLDLALVMHEVDVFEEQVTAYPAIVRLSRRIQGSAVIAETTTRFGPKNVRKLVGAVRGTSGIVEGSEFRLARLDGWYSGDASWPFVSPERLVLLKELEARLPTLEEAGTQVRVGVASGADDVFVVPKGIDIEADRLIPTVAAKDVGSGVIQWRDLCVVNPWNGEGLVELKNYPRLSGYFEDHRERLSERNVVKRKPDEWWRTIDRIHVETAGQPKLLIPDLKARIEPVLDEGTYYPLHSLYFVLSDQWDLRVLGGLLLSDIANFFVEAYSVRMANGYLRVSAQYLRRVRVPFPNDVTKAQKKLLTEAFNSRDRTLANSIARGIYGVDVLPD